MLAFLTLSLVFLRISEAGVNIGTSFEFCPTSGQYEYELTDKTVTGPTYNWTSTYAFAPFRQSQSLLVKAGDGVNNFKYFLYGKQGTITNQRQCSGTKDYGFIALINNYLFLINPSSETYYACKFDLSTVSNITPNILSTSGLPNVLQSFTPYLVTDQKIYVLASNSLVSRVVEYTWSTGTMTGVMAVGSTINVITEPIGTESFLYDKDTRSFIIPASNNLQWTTTTLQTIRASDLVIGYPLANKNVIMVILAESMTNANTYHILGSTNLNSMPNLEIFTFQITFYCDYLHNYLMVHSQSFSWITLSTKYPGTTYYTKFQNPKRGTIVSIGLSQNKAVIFYSSGQTQYYRHEGSGTVKKFPKMRVSTSIDWTSTKHYVLTANCLCQNLKKSHCFSGTLICVITLKAYNSCFPDYSTYQNW